MILGIILSEERVDLACIVPMVECNGTGVDCVISSHEIAINKDLWVFI
jgi:hypothetical protein